MSCFGSRTSSASSKSNASLVIHGGSGGFTHEQYPPELVRQHKEGMRDALYAGNRILASGGSALDAVVAAVRSMEDNPLFNAGKGAVFDISGGHELEASVAVSHAPSGASIPETRRGAAVTLLKRVKNPVLLARELYLDPKACPHTLVSGEDAERIAKEKECDMVDNHYFDTEPRWKEHREELGLPTSPYPPEKGEALPPTYTSEGLNNVKPWLPKGTVGAAALDSHGVLACATSTGGKTNKNVGRIGDTPSMGSGFYASSWSTPPKKFFWDILGSAKQSKTQGVAISGTGDGDYFIRNAAAYDVVARMKYKGQNVQEASKDVMEYLKTQGGEGGMICIDQDGQFSLPLNTSGMFRAVIRANEGIARAACWQDDELEEIH